MDKHSRMLIASNIELFLNYCIRFYDRHRYDINKDILVRLEKLLNDYYQSDKPQTIGLPSVTYCAAQLNLSTNYFGDLIKKKTGKTALEYIQSKIMDIAKQKMLNTRRTIGEIAYELGFKYPQHFTHVFKRNVGITPNEYSLRN